VPHLSLNSPDASAAFRSCDDAPGVVALRVEQL